MVAETNQMSTCAEVSFAKVPHTTELFLLITASLNNAGIHIRLRQQTASSSCCSVTFCSPRYVSRRVIAARGAVTGWA